MSKRSRFQAPRVLTDFAATLRALREVQESLDSVSQNRAELRKNLQSFNLVAGNFQRASAPAAGMQARLPKASGENLGDSITLHLEGMLGVLEVHAAPGDTVNGLATAEFTDDGVVVLWSNGVDSWSSVAQLPTNSPSGSALDAEYVLGAAHGSLPNGRVATDSTEIDAVLTTPNVVSWTLNVASVAFSKLANLTGLSVLGRAANSAGVMAAITSTAGRQVLRNNDAGTQLEWGNPVEAQLDGVDQGDVHTVNREDGRLSVASGVATFEKPQQVNDTQTGNLNAYALPATLKHGDQLSLIASGNIVLNGIDATGVSPGFTFFLNFSDGGVAGRTLTMNDESGSATATNRLSMPGDLAAILATGSSLAVRRASTRWAVYDASLFRVQDDGVFVDYARQINALSTTSVTATAAVAAGVASLSYQRAALTGAVTASANSNTTAFGALAAKSVLANATNASAVPAALAGSAAFQHLRVNSANNALEWATLSGYASTSITYTSDTFQRAALTGDVTASANSNTTTIANDAVTNPKLANMANSTLKARVTSGTGDPEDLSINTDTAPANIGEGATATGLAAQSRDDMCRWLSSQSNVRVFEEEFIGNLAACTARFTVVSGFAGFPTLSAVSNGEFTGGINLQNTSPAGTTRGVFTLGADENALNFNWDSLRYLCIVFRAGSSTVVADTQWAMGLVGPFASYGAITASTLGGTSEGIFIEYVTTLSSGQFRVGRRTSSTTSVTATGVAAAANTRYVYEVFRTAAGVDYHYLDGVLMRTDASGIAPSGTGCTFFSTILGSTTATRNFQLDSIKVVSQSANRFG